MLRQPPLGVFELRHSDALLTVEIADDAAIFDLDARVAEANAIFGAWLARVGRDAALALVDARDPQGVWTPAQVLLPLVLAEAGYAGLSGTCGYQLRELVIWDLSAIRAVGSWR